MWFRGYSKTWSSSIFFKSFLTLLIITRFCEGSDWIEERIKRDFEGFYPATAEEILRRFFELKEGYQEVLLCRIDHNEIHWTLSDEGLSSNWKVIRIIAYMDRLRQKYPLPDVTFLLSMSDGIAERRPPSEFASTYYIANQCLLYGKQPIPIFAFSKICNLRNVLLFPDFNMLEEIVYPEQYPFGGLRVDRFPSCPWEEKKEIAAFRGASTGYLNPRLPDWGNQRLRLALYSKAHPDLVDAEVALGYCGEQCEALKKWYLSLFGKLPVYMPHEELFTYKYLLDVDGFASTYVRYRPLLLSDSVAMKLSSPFEQWFYGAFTPWTHYVPVRNDLSDLRENISYLRHHDEIAHTIAYAGRERALEVFSSEQVDDYVRRLLLAYSKHSMLSNEKGNQRKR